MKQDKYLFTENPVRLTDSKWIICIDCGHGGMIDGKYQTAPDKMYDHGEFVFCEGVFNREVGKMFADLLCKARISYFFSTDSNYDVGLNIRTTRANNMAKLHPNKKHLYLSIHGNAAPKGAESASGIEVFTSKGDTAADPMANIFYKHLEGMGWKMRPGKKVDGKYGKEALFYVLTKTHVPAILVELGFYTNLEETKEMSKTEVQMKLATLLFKSVEEIINTKTDV